MVIKGVYVRAVPGICHTRKEQLITTLRKLGDTVEDNLQRDNINHVFKRGLV